MGGVGGVVGGGVGGGGGSRSGRRGSAVRGLQQMLASPFASNPTFSPLVTREPEPELDLLPRSVTKRSRARRSSTRASVRCSQRLDSPPPEYVGRGVGDEAHEAAEEQFGLRYERV